MLFIQVDHYKKKLMKSLQGWHISSHDITKKLNIQNQIVSDHLKKTSYKRKLDVLVPHYLERKMYLISFPSRKLEPFLKQLIVDGEK